MLNLKYIIRFYKLYAVHCKKLSTCAREQIIFRALIVWRFTMALLDNLTHVGHSGT